MNTKAANKGRKPRNTKQDLLKVKCSSGLKAALRREANRDNRSVANLVRKILIDALTERGAFASGAVA